MNTLVLLNGSLALAAGVVLYVLARGLYVLAKNRRNMEWVKEVLQFVMVIYLLLVVSVTLFPLALWIDPDLKALKYSVNLVPIISIIRDISQIGIAYGGDSIFMVKLILRNVGGNVLMFVPLGILAPMLWPEFRKLKSILLLGVLMSIGIEFLQFFELLVSSEMGRTVDIDDVICNTAGTIIGYVMYKLITALANKYRIKSLQQMFIGG
ncbi:VanZ family protein [Peribacillus sp. B-H-3]|uniref:VanZ family protein n=1 Tax=Peribacillus sp. B-H-3 TaxID=3400420 RepID=UPI003B011A42